ncbi:MBL fold metallo-hydrolase [bacterium]|nr:MBL fold metallo-hydrolase [bacterium]
MRFTFLGTAAANAFPEPFCSCDNCRAARFEGGKSLRKRSAALINDDLLIDLGPDIMSASQLHQVDLTQVKYCLQTHPHADHLDLSHLLSRSPGFGVVGAPVLHFYASAETLERANQTFRRDLSGHDLISAESQDELNLELHQIEPMKPLEIGPYRVIAFPANHAHGLGAMLYSIQYEGRNIFYGTDTASLFEETWQALREYGLQFDLVVLDHTYGPEEKGSDHLSALQLAEHVQRMRDEGYLSHRDRAFATHIAHEGNPPHSELVEFAKQHGYEVAYDGLVLTVSALGFIAG